MPKEIEYKVTYVDGSHTLIRVETGFINVGMEVALYRARSVTREISSVEFWQVVSHVREPEAAMSA